MRGRTARIRCRVCGESLLVSGESAEPETTSSESRPPASSPSPAEVRTTGERISEDTSRMGRMSFENTAPMEDVSELRALAQRMTPSYGEASGEVAGPVESPPPTLQFSSKTTMPMFGNAGAKRAEAASASSPPASTSSEVPPAPESNPSTGARNSTSILFSLAALAEKERSQVVAIGPRSEKELAAVPAIDGEGDDHSGLIDLHRLMPSGSKLSVQLVKPASSSEPPLAVTRDVPKPAPRTKRVVLFATLGILLLVGVAVGMRSVLKWAAAKDMSRLAAAQAAAIESPAHATAPPPTDEEPKLDSLVPPPPPAAEVTAAASDATVTKAVKSKSRKHRHSSRRSKAAQAPTEAPAPSNDPCHCNGDLACSMRCAIRN